MEATDYLNEIEALLSGTASPKETPPQPLSEESLSALYAMAYELYRNGKYEDAKGFFRFLTIANTFECRFWIGLGACYQMLKDYAGAIECYSVAAVQNPDDPYVHFYAAECFFHGGDSAKAIKTLESALIVAKKTSEHCDLIPKLQLLYDTWSKKINGERHA